MTQSSIPKLTKGLNCHLMLLLILLINGCSNGSNQDVEIKNTNGGQLQMLRIGGLDLSPAFEITQKHYVSTAAHSVSKINLQAWTKHKNDKVSVNGQLLNGKDNYNLAVGNNRFTIVVTSKEGQEEQYQLTVTRLSETDPVN